MTADLVAWLTQILDEDEALAKDANVKQDDPVWWVSRVAMSWPQSYTVRSKQDNRPIARVEDVAGDEDTDITGILDGGSVAAHIALHDPAAVLADIAAKRAIITAYVEAQQAYETVRGTFDGDNSPGAKLEVFGYAQAAAGLLTAVRLLASAYAARPGYDESWRT